MHLSKTIFNKNSLRILGFYLVGGWGILEFVSFLVDHYMLSSSLIDVCLVTLISMIPSIMIIAYYWGIDGEHKWTRFEKIGIPVNLIATVIFIFILFQDKELGATTTTIIVEDEEGQKIERVIPKSEFRKKAVIFFFDNETADPKLNWLQYGIAVMLQADLSQDIFFDITLPNNYASEMMEAGFSKGVDLPLMLKRKIANKIHYKYFISGKISKQHEEFSVTISLYETKRTKLITENTFNGKDIFNLTDEISVQIKEDLEVPARHIEEMTDLPVSEITTNSVVAFKLAINGYTALLFDNNYEEGIEYLERSVKEDPSFAVIYNALHGLYLNTNMNEKREQALELMMKYLYKLPEDKQYHVKAMYHHMKGNPEKRLTILKMWSDLYPDDISPHVELVRYYHDKDQLEKAVSENKLILELDPEQYNCIREIGDIYKQKGNYETALKYYEQYAEIFPDEYESFTTIGDLYKTIGDYPMAKSSYEKAVAMEPEKISTMVKLARIEYRTGNFDKAFEQYENALNLCKSPEDKESVYGGFSSLYSLTGQMNKSIEYLELYFDEQEKYVPPIVVLTFKLFYFHRYISAGKKDYALQIIQTIESQLQPPFDNMIPLAYCEMYIALSDTVNPDKAESALEEFEQAYNKGEVQLLSSVGLIGYHGDINVMKGNYEEAILNYRQELKQNPTDVSINIDIGKCYRKMKQLKKAEECLENCLKVLPFYPEAHYEIALVYSELEDKEKALEHLKTALDIWKDADDIFKPAQQAKKKLKEWEG
ncbi:MAG: hypothetical protein COC01_00480 [Bacteroidetes bacterium]|nr:MAG: hypothetical protein COC01_00480 [Bacteroidota bacterium]